MKTIISCIVFSKAVSSVMAFNLRPVRDSLQQVSTAVFYWYLLSFHYQQGISKCDVKPTNIPICYLGKKLMFLLTPWCPNITRATRLYHNSTLRGFFSLNLLLFSLIKSWLEHTANTYRIIGELLLRNISESQQSLKTRTFIRFLLDDCKCAAPQTRR